MYTDKNFKSKKALKEAVAAGEQVTYFQPGGMFPTPVTGTQRFCVEGPHGYHKWYAECIAQDGVIIKVK